MVSAATNSKRLKIVGAKAGRRILASAEVANSPSDRKSLEVEIERAVGAVEWKNFGGEGRVAHSAIGAMGDAVHLAGEPIVNEADSLLEMMRHLAALEGDTYIPTSPRDAAAHYFGLPAAGMGNWDTHKGAARKLFEEAARKSQLLIYPGSGRDEATLSFFDHGIGQHPLAFEGTVLSLQLGLKADIPYLSGQFGHGAGLTLNFSNGGQIIVSRRHPSLLDPGHEDLVGVTIVRKFQPSETGTVHPAYRYLVDKDTGNPIAISPSALADPQWHGLRRTCIDYELGAPAKRLGDAPTGGLYWHLDHLLPSPALPWSMRDERGSNPQWRFMQGVNSRLTSRANGWSAPARKNPISVIGPSVTTVDVTAFANDGYEYGSIDVSTWVVDQQGTTKGNDLYGPPGAAETWALNGQVHESRPREHFAQKPIELDGLKNHLRVNVMCDGLNADTKADVFTTGRQGIAERRAARVIEAAIDDVLASDEELRALDQQIKEDALKRAAEATDKDLQKALEDFNHLFEQEVEVRTGHGKKKRRSGPKRPTPTIAKLAPIQPLYPEPSFLRFRKVFRSELKLRPGATASVLVEADAVDDYFPEEESLQVNIAPDLGKIIRIYATERLRGGRMRVHLRASEEVMPGTKAVLSISCLPGSASRPLLDTICLTIVEPLSGNPGPSGKVRKEVRKVAPPFRILWQESASGATWASEGLDWTEDTVGQFQNGIAYVNGDYAPLKRLLESVRADQQKSILNLFVPPVVMTLVSFNKRESEPPNDETGSAIPLHDTYREAGLQSAALSSIFTIRRLKKLGLGPIGG